MVKRGQLTHVLGSKLPLMGYSARGKSNSSAITTIYSQNRLFLAIVVDLDYSKNELIILPLFHFGNSM